MSTRNHQDLLKLFLKCLPFGFMVSALFLVVLITFGQSAGAMLLWLFVLNGMAFSGVQFVILILSSDNDDNDGERGRVFLAEPVPVRIKRPQQRRR
ncbi:MAG: hypothetical protein AAGL89_10175 [Pseudomonadota bacterium]